MPFNPAPSLAAALGLGLGAALLTAPAAGQILDTFDPAGGLPVGVAYGDDRVYVYDNFSANINVYDRSGTLITSFASPGASSNDYDLDIAGAGLSLGGVAVAADTLLVINGDDNPDTVYGLDPITGATRSSVTIGNDMTVGVTYAGSIGRLVSLDWDSDVVRFFDPADGSQTGSFTVSPAGSPAFGINYGDLDIDAFGNLVILSDTSTTARVMDLAGNVIEDIDLTVFGPDGLDASGIAFDLVRDEVWVTSVNGSLYRIGDLRVPEPASVLAMLPAAMLLRRRSR